MFSRGCVIVSVERLGDFTRPRWWNICLADHPMNKVTVLSTSTSKFKLHKFRSNSGVWNYSKLLSIEVVASLKEKFWDTSYKQAYTDLLHSLARYQFRKYLSSSQRINFTSYVLSPITTITLCTQSKSTQKTNFA